MNFIGVIGKTRILKNIIDNHVNIIKINSNNIENIKNVKFQIVIINNDLKDFILKETFIKSIIENADYLIINSDLELKIDILSNIKQKIITCGLKQKSTITASSITEDNVLIDLQRNIETLNNKNVETQEKLIKLTENESYDIHEILINYAISVLYNKKIMDKV